MYFITGERGFLGLSKIIEHIDDCRMNQQIQERKPEYIDRCTYRLKKWHDFMEIMESWLEIAELDDIQLLHMKKYIIVDFILHKDNCVIG